MELSLSLDGKQHGIGPLAPVGIPGHPKFYRSRNFTTADPIHAISSSMEPPWPVDVQQHRDWPIGFLLEYLLGINILENAVTPQ